jgi:hypothetical protein
LTPTRDSAVERSTPYAQGGTPLTMAVQMFPTPSAASVSNDTTVLCSSDGWTKPNKLGWAVAAAMFPTPQAGKVTDKDEASWRARRERGDVATPPLALAVRMIPTPTVGDSKSAARAHCTEGAMHYGVTLTDYARQDGGVGRMLPTPTTQDAANHGTPSQRRRNTPPLNAVVGGQLNADWVELLMGWPDGWTRLPPGTGPATGRRSRGSPKDKPTASLDSAP